uniref:kielin/chordin-like protein isoform X1 n=2 Tax=Styela clava TaxID=7725 RepID=UPI001939EE24|nr:kielin/chordin-like protein isoform X1 [Styela clava]XP_039265116.1 kielin/chordin-like protein isoform X2 [Styela clava]
MIFFIQLNAKMALSHISVLMFLVCSSAIERAIAGGCIPECPADPCETASCPNHPEANCRVIIAGCTCRAVFSNSGGDLSTEDCSLGSGPCRPTPCKPDPCDTAECSAQPGATCKSDTCTGCVARFEYGGKTLTAHECLLSTGPIPDLCPDGKPPVNCARDPCQGATCPAVSDADCRANYCGGCNADFYIGNRKLADHLCIKKESCPPHMPQAGCFSPSGGSCLGQTCRLVPDAECYIDGCGGCKVIWYRGRQRLTDEDCNGCPPFAPRDCNPCNEGTCPDHPDARCEPKRCRMCKAVFFGPDRKEIDTCCKEETCEDGTRKFHCKNNPCDGAECPAIPNAVCKPNYCGGCKREWSDRRGRRTFTEADCAPLDYCPIIDGPVPSCHGGPCLGKTCPNYPGATCKIDACRSCDVVFYYNGKRLTDEDCNGCPGGNEVIGCGDPCLHATCRGFDFLRCEVQRCGECKARFFGIDRLEVTCLPDQSKAETCSDGSEPYLCKVDPCDVASCPALADLVYCKPNYCGGCKAEFFYLRSNLMVEEHYCTGTEDCPGDVPVAGCLANPPGADCLGQKCPNYPNAKCIVDGCNGCNVVFFDGQRRLTGEDCNGCPTDQPEVACIDPCKHALCPQYPEARCEPRRCGKCSVAFFGLDRAEIKDCCGKGSLVLPKPETCPGNKVWRRCAPRCRDSCQLKHDRCTRDCDPDNHCICPPGTIEETTGSNNCIKPSDCPSAPCPPRNCGIVPPCFRPNCPGYPSAVCKASNCDCSEWYEDAEGNRVDCDVPCTPKNCGIVPLCRIATCPGNPFLKCRSSQCDCSEWYEDRHGNRADCKIPECPGDKIYTLCASVCENSCDFEYGLCTSDCSRTNHCVCPPGTIMLNKNSNICVKPETCPGRIHCDVPKELIQGIVAPGDRDNINEGEYVVYRCDAGFRMRGGSRRKCINRKGKGKLVGLHPKCYDMFCPKLDYGYGGCVSNCRSNAECGYKKICCRNGCASVCLDEPSKCPGGRPPVQCFANPCDGRTCPRYPEKAVCKPNYCDGCGTEWYIKDVLLLPNDCSKPADLRCPSLKFAIKLCLDACRTDSDCNDVEVCCFDGCGHRCYGYS